MRAKCRSCAKCESAVLPMLAMSERTPHATRPVDPVPKENQRSAGGKCFSTIALRFAYLNQARVARATLTLRARGHITIENKCGRG